MDAQLAYLKSVIEGEIGIEPWKAWFARNDAALQKGLTRTQYLNLKLHRIKAIPSILASRGIKFEPSSRYDFLGGIEGRCRECGTTVLKDLYFAELGGWVWCPNGCFRMHALRNVNRG